MAAEVTVILPCYNGELYIEKTILSIQNQTFNNWECVVVNDGSTDKSLEIIKETIKNDSRFVLLTQENKGLSISRNRGLEVAKSHYVYFLDADDLLHENTLKILIEKQNDSIEIITAKIATTLGHNAIEKGFLKYPACVGNAEIHSKYKFLLLAVEHGITCTVQNRLIKKDFLIKNNIKFKENLLHEDELFFFELFYNASNVLFIDEVTYYYNIGNNESITKNFRYKNLSDCLLIIKEIYSKYYVNNTTEGKEVTALYLTNFKRLIFKYLKRLTNDDKNKIAIEIKNTLLETKVIRTNNLLNAGFEKRLNKFHVVSNGSINLISKYQDFVNKKTFFNSIFVSAIFKYSLIKNRNNNNF